MKYAYPVLLFSMLAAVFVFPVHALQDGGVPGLELTAIQIGVLAFVTSILVQAIRLAIELATKLKFVVPSIVLQIFVFCVSIVLTLSWFPVNFPTFPPASGSIADTAIAVLQWLGLMYSAGSPVALASFLIYDYLVKQVSNEIGIGLGISGYMKTKKSTKK